jgi:Cytochrome c554 and c-prime
MLTKHWLKWVVAIYVGSAAALSSVESKNSQGSRFSPVIQENGKPTKMYYGVLACSNNGCHDNPTNPNQKDIILCGYDEVRIWSTQDKHKDANKVLTGPLAKQMAKLLGIKGDFANEAACISCHGVLVDDPKKIHKPSFNLNEGVSCGVCHGMNKEWVAKHSDFLERETWRALSRTTKETQFGMTDLWNPEKRALLCASCHIGNAAEGKVVTHAMYAAGHPPLPSFELATFSDAMPRHWKYLAEKPAPVQKILNYDPAKVGLEQTQLAMIAGLVSFRESMNLLASQALQDAEPKHPDKGWPELAQFDCYACHHDLKSKSWRQERGYAGKPGRPNMRAWPAALVHLGILQAGKGDAKAEAKFTKDLLARMKALTDAFDAQPFGDPKAVATAAKQAADWAGDLLKRIQDDPVDRTAARRLLDGLRQESAGRLLDFDSARQLAWTFRAIQNELNPKFAASAETAKLLKELENQLSLDLPKGQVEISKEYLKDVLEKLNDYEPERFRKSFELLIEKTMPSK